MANESNAGRNAYGNIAPTLGEYTDKVLFGDVWERPGLSLRDRSLITVCQVSAHHHSEAIKSSGLEKIT